MMEIQQHDGVVVEVAGSRQSFAKRKREGEVSWEGEGGARGCGAAALPPPTIYRPPGGGAPALEPIYKGGLRPRGKLPPQVKWGAPHPQGFQP